MANHAEQPRTRNRARWAIGAAMAGIASIAAVISYNDGLTVARIAGNHGRTAYLYPLLPDGLIVICLSALYEAAQRKLKRPVWASVGLVLGIALTLAQNTGAGIGHGPLDAIMDGLVPVVFFVAVEVLIWHVRTGRAGTAGESVASDSVAAAEASMAATIAAGNPLSVNQLTERFGLTRAQATKVRQSAMEPAPEPESVVKVRERKVARFASARERYRAEVDKDPQSKAARQAQRAVVRAATGLTTDEIAAATGTNGAVKEVVSHG